MAVEEVQRSALAVRTSRCPAKELGHHRSRREAASERLTVIAIRRDDVVVGSDHRERTGAHRFLPDVEMTESADLAERVGFGGALLEPPLEEHGPQQLVIQLAIRRQSV